VVHFVDVMCRVDENMHLKHFEMVFVIGLGRPQKEDSLMAGDRVVDLDVA